VPERQLLALLRAAVATAWLFGLWWVLVPHPESQVAFGFLTAYCLGIAYAVVMWNRGDRDGSTAILLSVLLPPVAWVLLAIHWVDHHRDPRTG
jgi:hypothetical protein